MNAVMQAIKLICFVIYAFAAFLLTPLVIVGTGSLITSWLGSSWWVCFFIVGPVSVMEFIAGIGFFLWEDNPIPRWITN